MKIAVFGTGGVGGYFGGLLAQAGHDVTFIARGEHLAAIRANGLQVFSVSGNFTIQPVQAADDPAEIGVVDYVVVGVKHYHLPDIAPQISPLVGPNTTVVPLLNGVDAHEALIETLGEQPVVGGLCAIVSMIEAPGIIRQTSKLRRVVVGELDHTRSERVEQLVSLWRDQGAEAINSDDIHASMWTKLLFIASFGGITSLARVNAGELLACDESRTLFIDAMREVADLARAQNIVVAPDAVANALAMVERLEPAATSSMQRDAANGKPFELEAFSGTIVRLGAKFGVPTPIHGAIYALLRPALIRSTAD